MNLNKINTYIKLALSIVRYNIKIVFGNRFIYFMLAAVVFFIFVMFMNLLENEIPSESGFYYILLFPGLLLIFYPTAYGIQGDADANTLEILFGIPDYRYKVWLVRIFIILLIASAILFLLSFVSHILLVDINVVKMVYQLMFPVMFIACLSFMFSTVVKSGNGTAIVVIIICIIFWMLIYNEYIGDSAWNVFFNPFEISQDTNQIIFEEKLFKNRLYLTAGSVLALLYGLYNLQRREKFI